MATNAHIHRNVKTALGRVRVRCQVRKVYSDRNFDNMGVALTDIVQHTRAPADLKSGIDEYLTYHGEQKDPSKAYRREDLRELMMRDIVPNYQPRYSQQYRSRLVYRAGRFATAPCRAVRKAIKNHSY